MVLLFRRERLWSLSIVDRAYLIYDGRVESEGTKDFLINDPISRQLYLGERFKM